MSTFEKNNPFSEDDYYNGFDESKNYYEVRALAGRVAQSREDNEIQSILKNIIYKNFKTLYKDGSLISGGGLKQDPELPQRVEVAAAQVFFEGIIHDIPASPALTIESGDQRIGVEFTKEVVTDNGDITLRDPATGWENFSQPGATRLKITGQWKILGASPTSPNTIEYYRFFDRNLVSTSKVAAGNQFLTDVLARRTMDESGNYVVTGFQISKPTALPSESSLTTYVNVGGSTASGSSKAYVNGYEVVREYTSALNLKKAADANHKLAFSDSGKTPTGGRVFPISFSPVAALVDGQLDIIRTFDVLRTSLNIDTITLDRQDSIITILEVYALAGDGTKINYSIPVLSGGTRELNWTAIENKPDSGTVYTIRVKASRKLLSSEFQVGPDGESIVLNDNVDSWASLIHDNTEAFVEAGEGRYSFDYEYFIPRADLIVLEATEGASSGVEIKAIEGVPSIVPVVPSIRSGAQLAIGHVIVAAGLSGEVSIVNYDVRRLTMLDLRKLLNRLERAEYNIAATSLEQEGVAKANSSSQSLRGVFTEAFTYTVADLLANNSRVKFARYQASAEDATTSLSSIAVKEKVFSYPELAISSPTTLGLSTTLSASNVYNNSLFKSKVKAQKSEVLQQLSPTGRTKVNEFAVPTIARPEITISPSEANQMFWDPSLSIDSSNPYNLIRLVSKFRPDAADQNSPGTALSNASGFIGAGGSELGVKPPATIRVTGSNFYVEKNPANEDGGDSNTTVTVAFGQKQVNEPIKNDGTFSIDLAPDATEALKINTAYTVVASSSFLQTASTNFFSRGISLSESVLRDFINIVDVIKPDRPRIATVRPGDTGNDQNVYVIDTATRKVTVKVKKADFSTGIASYAYILFGTPETDSVTVKVNDETASRPGSNRYVAELKNGEATFEVTLPSTRSELSFVTFLSGPGGFSTNFIKGLIATTESAPKPEATFGSFTAAVNNDAAGSQQQSVTSKVTIATNGSALDSFFVLSSYVDFSQPSGSPSVGTQVPADSLTSEIPVFCGGVFTDIIVFGVNSAGNNILVDTVSTLGSLNPFSVKTTKPGVDPTAQTFRLGQSCWVSGIKLFFSAIPNAPLEGQPAVGGVSVEIREVIAGLPSSEEVLTDAKGFPAVTSLTRDQITLSNANQVSTKAGTTFTFKNPVWLKADKTYAFVVTCAETEYEIFFSSFNRQVLGKTGTEYRNELSSGVMLKSSDALTWTPVQDSDLCFVIEALEFQNENTQVSFNPVTVTPTEVVPGSSPPVQERLVGFRLDLPETVKLPDAAAGTSWGYAFSSDGPTVTFNPNSDVYFLSNTEVGSQIYIRLTSQQQGNQFNQTQQFNPYSSFAIPADQIRLTPITRRNKATYVTKAIRAVAEGGTEVIDRARVIMRIANGSNTLIKVSVRKVSTDGTAFGDWKVISPTTINKSDIGIPNFEEYEFVKDVMFTAEEDVKNVQFKFEFEVPADNSLLNPFKLRDIIIILNGGIGGG